PPAYLGLMANDSKNMTQASGDPDKGREERVPFGANPRFFFRLMAASKTPRIVFYVVAFAAASWWYPNGALLPILGILVLLELGPWNWPRQMIWRGKKAVTLNNVIIDFLAQMRYA